MIPTYTQHNFSSIKLRLCCRLRRFFLVSPLRWKDPFFIASNWERGNFSGLRDAAMDMRSFLLSLLWVWGPQTPRLLTFPNFFKWQQIVDWDVLRGRANPEELLCGSHSTLLKHLDGGLMNDLVCIHLSMMYCRNENLKTSFRFGSM